LFNAYLALIAQDMSEELADQIVSAVREELDEQALEDATVVRAAVRRHLAAFIPCDAVGAGFALDSRATDGRPFTLALIGPTGVGKTTTIAKLAATVKLRQGKSVGLITADTYRIAAVDQLRTYAEIIDVPLHVACTPAEMKRAVAALSDRDVILIDTAGRSQKDAGRLAELRRFLNAAQPHEVHLVLSGTAGERTLLEEAGAFSPLGVHKIVLTKLDEAVSFGMLISALRQIGMALSFVTTGQEVPDDIEPGRGITDRLAALALGEKSEATVRQDMRAPRETTHPIP
jgi:flagellar biosynthesis protein FlhF